MELAGKLKRKIIRKVILKVMAAILPLLLVFIVSTAIITAIRGQGNSSTDTGIANVSQEVLAWKPVVEKYAGELGMGQYVNLILAVIQQESGGTLTDVMQASESGYNTQYSRSPNSITSPEYSIYCGIQELKEDLQKAGVTSPGDIQGISLALQAYNFGEAFISFAKSHGGYSLEVAKEFSSMEAQACGWSSYGDCNYVPHVLQYYSTGTGTGIGTATGKLASVIQIAQAQLGKPYVWGASGADSFDCSGLVYYCYLHAGFSIQRLTAQDYYNSSTPTTNPDVGDLVFFGTPGNIHHIGIYVGGGQMINAPHTGDVVKIQSVSRSDLAGFGKYKN